MSTNIGKSLWVVITLSFTMILSGCEKPKIEDQAISTGSIIHEAKPKWRVDAANGDLDAAYALAMFDSGSSLEREGKLLQVARKGHFAAARDLCNAYGQGSLLGIKKDCALARKWCAETQKIRPSVVFDFDLDQECPP